MLVGSLVISTVVIVIVNLITYGGSGKRAGLAFSALLLALCLLGFMACGIFVSASAILNVVFLLILEIYWAGQRTDANGFAECSIGCLIASHLIVAGFSLGRFSEQAERQTKYPFESMSQRLAYESDPEF
jgi:hypothetical protein